MGMISLKHLKPIILVALAVVFACCIMRDQKGAVPDWMETAAVWEAADGEEIGESEAVLLNAEPGVHEDVYYSSVGRPMEYRVYIPENAAEGMPVIVWLHGAGTVNMPEFLDNHGVIRAARESGENRFIIIQPCAPKRDWTAELGIVSDLINAVAEQYHCDLNRVILTGHSLGAMGVWYWANSSDRWAAVVPVAEAPITNTPNLETSEVPMWVFCADGDRPELRQAIKKAADQCFASGTHKEVRFTELENTGHVEEAYCVYTKEVFDWMYGQAK